MKPRNRLSHIFICVYLLFLSTSCEKRQFAPPPPSPDPSDIFEPVSQQFRARIYIDATVSMEGFVVPGASTNYAQILQPLESTAIGGWPNAKVEFYQFGTQVLPLQGRDYLRAAKRVLGARMEIDHV